MAVYWGEKFRPVHIFAIFCIGGHLQYFLCILFDTAYHLNNFYTTFQSGCLLNNHNGAYNLVLVNCHCGASK